MSTTPATSTPAPVTTFANCDRCTRLNNVINLVRGNCGPCRGEIGRMFQPGPAFSSSSRPTR